MLVLLVLLVLRLLLLCWLLLLLRILLWPDNVGRCRRRHAPPEKGSYGARWPVYQDRIVEVLG